RQKYFHESVRRSVKPAAPKFHTSACPLRRAPARRPSSPWTARALAPCATGFGTCLSEGEIPWDNPLFHQIAAPADSVARLRSLEWRRFLDSSRPCERS